MLNLHSSPQRGRIQRCEPFDRIVFQSTRINEIKQKQEQIFYRMHGYVQDALGNETCWIHTKNQIKSIWAEQKEQILLTKFNSQFRSCA